MTASTLTTTTLVGTPSAMNITTLSEKQCPACGRDGAVESHHRIQELEGQVQALTERAAVTGKQEDSPGGFISERIDSVRSLPRVHLE